MSEQDEQSKEFEDTVRSLLADVSRKFERAKAKRVGSILLRLTGEGGGDYYVHATDAGCHVSMDPGSAPHDFEVSGDARRICAILDGSKEGRAQYYEGGMLVRGDLQYLSELAHELGFIAERF